MQENTEQESYCLVDEDIKKLRLELGQSIFKLKKIYLDTKYWIMIRDVVLQKSEHPYIKDILELLKKGVAEKKLICPIYYPTFIEIIKQDDDQCLQCTIDLIDALSGGVCLLYDFERIPLELTYFYYTWFGMQDRCYPPHALAWTRISQIMGTTVPYNHMLPLEANLILQRGFLGTIWKKASLNEMKDIMGMENFRYRPREAQMERITDNLNSGKFQHEDEVTSFQNVFQSEVAGFIDTIKPVIASVTANVCERISGAPVQEKDIRIATNMIYNLFKENRVGTLLPTIDIQASIHAAIRYDKGRKYKNNDITDFEHATGALPYFDLFLTERSLCTLLNRKDMNLAYKYNCKVLFNNSDAYQALINLL